MTVIHPTAVVDPQATLGPDVEVGPHCYVAAGATLGAHCRLISHAVILGGTTLGDHNTVWPHATLGADPQDLKYADEPTQLVIGHHNQFREHVTIHRGTGNGGGVTKLGNDNLIMVAAHVAHDCVIGDHVVIANASLLAGHVLVEDHAVISGATAVQHYVTIGQYAYVAGMTRVVQDVPPFMVVEGNPARVRGVNTIGLERHRFEPEVIDHLKQAHRHLYRSEGEDSLAAMGEHIARIESDYPDDECVLILTRFLKNMAGGFYGRYREATRSDNRRRAAPK